MDASMKIETPEQAAEDVARGVRLDLVPEQFRTPELCLAACRRRWQNLMGVPPHLKTAEMCEAAVHLDGSALQDVPDEFKTPELCAEAVRSRGEALQWVPEELKSPELCREAVALRGMALQWVPDAMKTPELCLDACAAEAPAVQYVPEALLTEDMAMASAKAHGGTLEFLPERLRTPKVCLDAVKGSGRSELEWIPEPFWDDPKFCASLCVRCPEALRFMPEASRTPKACLAAIKREGWLWDEVPDASKTSELFGYALESCPNCIKPGTVPERLLDEAACRALVSKSSPAWYLALPERFQTFGTASLAAAKFGRLVLHFEKSDRAAFWNSVPEEWRQDLATEAAKAGARLESIPEELWTKDVIVRCRQNCAGESIHRWWKNLAEDRKTPEMAAAFAGALAWQMHGGNPQGFLAGFLDRLPDALKTPETVLACIDEAEPGLGSWLADSGMLAAPAKDEDDESEGPRP